MNIRFLRRFFSYNGSMEFQQLSDGIVEANYQHKYVVEKYLSYIENRKVLDAGCWTGPVEKEILERGINTELIGIDENEEALNVATKNFAEFTFIQCELTKPSERFISNYKGYFDTIIFLDVIEHLSKGSEVEVMKFFNKILRPNGVIIMSTMADHICNFIDPAWFFGHRHYKISKLQELLGKAGFQSIEILKIGNLYWDLDILLFYIYKYIFKKKYETSQKMSKRIYKGFISPIISTRYYIKAIKN